MYDESFLFNKALALSGLIEDHQRIKEILETEMSSSTELSKRLANELKAEIHFTEFHQFECFFALLIAIFQELPHWLFLTTYAPGYIKSKAEEYLRRDINSLTNGQFTKLNDFLNYAIYDIYHSCTEEEKLANWQANLNNIAWVLDRMSKKYINRGQEYNAYKHGLRIMVGSAYMGMIPDANPSGAVAFDFGDAVAFLELKDEQPDAKTVYHTLHCFSMEESLNHLLIMRRILETIKSARLARIKEEKIAQINTFFDLKKDVLHELETITTWSNPV